MNRILKPLLIAFLAAAFWLGSPDALAQGREPIATVSQAEQYAKRFLSHPYVALRPDDGTLAAKEQEGTWICSLTAENGSANVTLRFDRSGRVLQLACDAYPVCSLDGISLAAKLDALPQEQCIQANQICDSLFPGDIWCSGDIIGLTDAPDGRYYTVIGDGFNATLTYYFVLKPGPAMRLVGFGDLRRPDTRYGSYLSRKEAGRIARDAVRKAYPDAAHCELKISQAEFVTAPGYFNEGQVSVPFWFVAINDGSLAHYELCIDAKDGTVQELLDAETCGKG